MSLQTFNFLPADTLSALKGLFTLEVHFNFWTFLLAVAFLGALVGGYYLIANQVKLVKKEVWNWTDRLKCGLYAFIFAFGAIIIIAMMVTFRNGANYQYTGPFILIPLILCLLYITIYPVIDLFYMAKHKEMVGLTPFQELLEKFILKKFKPPMTYVVAILMYVVFWLLPPILLMMYGQIEFIFVWVSWQLIWPLCILTFYGAKGYISGLMALYTRIPRLSRSGFLAFDESERFSKELLKDPFSRIGVIMMLYLYVWTFISLITTTLALDPNYVLKSTMSYAFTVYIVLFFGIYGYFSRFWGRKIKFQTMDLLFAAYLIAAVGINVLINFVLVNGDILAVAFNEWELTRPITEIWTLNEAGANVGKSRWYVPAAIIEETVLVIFISYYFFEKKHQFMNDAAYSEVTKAGDAFQPIQPFNLLRSTDLIQRNHAADILRLMYDRVPIKTGYNILDPRFKDPLFDAVCDPNPIVKKFGLEILASLMKNHPKEILPAIEESLRSPNLDKMIAVGTTILSDGDRILPLLNAHFFFEMLQHPGYHIRNLGISLIKKFFTEDSVLRADQLDIMVSLLNDGDYNLQAEVITFLGRSYGQLPASVIFEKLNHPNNRIKGAAAEAISKIKYEEMDERAIPFLLKMLENNNAEIKASAMGSLSKIGNFTKFNIPIQPFLDGLYNPIEMVRKQALKGVLSYLQENPDGIDFKKIADSMENKDTGVQSILLQVFSAGWEQDPKQIFRLLIQSLRSLDDLLAETALKELVDIGQKNPVQIVELLLKEKETETFIKRGMISSTIIQIAQKNPQKVLPILLAPIADSDSTSRFNAISSLSDLSEKFSHDIGLKPLMTTWSQDNPLKIKQDVAKAIVNVALSEPEKIRPLMPVLNKALSDPDKNVQKIVARLFIDLAEKLPDIVPLSVIKLMIQDSDASMREIGMNLIRASGQSFPKESIQFLMLGLKDKEWNVKNATADAITGFGEKIDKPEILTEIKSMLSNPEKWTRLKAIEVLQKAIDNKVKVLSLDEAIELVNRPQEEELFIANAAKILGFLGADDFKKSFPLMLKLLAHPSEKVREGMITGMIRLSALIPMKTLIPNLLKYLSDQTEMTLQQSIALLLKRIVRYESDDIKNRVISLLKIRCEMSQDSIICGVLSDLQG